MYVELWCLEMKRREGYIKELRGGEDLISFERVVRQRS